MRKTLLLILGMTATVLAHSATVTAGDMLDIDTNIAYAKEKAMLEAVSPTMPSPVPVPTPASSDLGAKHHVPANRVYAVFGVGEHLNGQMIFHGVPSPEFSVGSVVDGNTVKSLSLQQAVLVDAHGKETIVPVRLGDTSDQETEAPQGPLPGTVVTVGGQVPHSAVIPPRGFQARGLDVGGPVGQTFAPQGVVVPAAPPSPTPVTPYPSAIAAMSGGPGMGAVPPHPVQAFTPASLSALQH
jgi:hypothetical protein